MIVLCIDLKCWDNTMKITFIINSLSYKSGTERVTCNLANLFVEKLGYKVSVLNRDTEFNRVAYHLNTKVEVLAFKGNYFNFYQQIQSYIDEKEPDFILIHNMGRLSLLCSALSKKNTKFISLEHVAFDSRPMWVRFLSKLCYKKIDKVVTLTHRDKLSYTSWFKNVSAIYNISPFLIPDKLEIRNKEIIAVGRLTYQKNFQVLLKAWQQIQSQVDDWSLKIYGTGEDFDELSTIIHNHQLKNVELMGQASQIEQIYQKSSLFVMSSRFEGLPMVLIEAQTFGLPIISFDCPHGPAEVIHHQKNGLLVENQNVTALANAMLSLMQNDEQREQYSLQAFKDAERFQEYSILTMWKNLLEK